MKKPLVAVAAMAAVTGAMAQATIYGTIEQTYNKSTTTLNGTTISQKSGIGEYQMGTSLIGFKGSEDMDNGIKASYLYEMGISAQTTASPINRQAFVGLSGGFGAVRIGKQYSQGFLNAVTADPGGATGATGALYLAPMTGYNGSEAPLRQDQAIQFDLPSFVPGLGITITKVWGGKNTAALGAGDNTSGTDGVKTGDGTGWAIKYNTGPLYVGFTSDSVTNTGINFGYNDDAIAQTLTDAAVPATVNNLTAGSSTSKNKLSTATITYDLGIAKVGYNQTKMAVGAEFLKASMTSVSVPLGAVTAFYSSSSGDINSTSGVDASGGDTSVGVASLKGTQYGANYALSKRTVAYIHAGRLTADLTDLGAIKKVNNYGIGIHHSF